MSERLVPALSIRFPSRQVGRLRVGPIVIISMSLFVAQLNRAEIDEAPVPQQRDASSPDEIVVILNPSVSPQGLTYLASVTIPLEHRTRPGESLAAIAKKRYGIQNRFRSSLRELNAQLAVQFAQKGKDLMWAVLPENTSVKLLPISRIGEDVHVTVDSAADVTQLAAEYYPEAGPKTVASIEVANKGAIRAGKVPRGTRLTLPWVPTVQVLRVKPGTAEGVLAMLKSRDIATGFKNRYGLLEQPVTTPSPIRDIQADERWFTTDTSAAEIQPQDLKLRSDVIMAILDSGIDTQNPAFAHDLWTDKDELEGYIDDSVDETHGFDAVDFTNDVTDMEPHSHGTHVAGIASGRLLKDWSSAFGGSDLDDRVKLMIVKVVREELKQKNSEPDTDNSATTTAYTKEYSVDVGGVLVGIDFASKHNAKIVSGSWNFASLPELEQTIEAKTGMLFIFAAGNGRVQYMNGEAVNVGYDIDSSPVYPASFRLPNVITVGALDPHDERAYFSNFGSGTVQLFAPGYKIKSTVAMSSPGYPFAFESGTSQATPFVALAAALIWAKDGTLDAPTVRRRILDTADPVPGLLKESQYGRLNLLKAIAIDTDLFQLASDHKVVRGTIVGNTIRIATDGTHCDSTIPLDLAREKPVRLFFKYTGESDLLVTRGERRSVKLCDPLLQLRTSDGKLITKKPSELADVVWRLNR